MLEKDKSIVYTIIEYCDYIEKIMSDLNNDYDAFMNDYKSQQSISFDILQIGESVNKLSPEFKRQNNSIEWHKIIGMRNYVAHDYGAIDYFVLFNTAIENIPELKSYLMKCN